MIYIFVCFVVGILGVLFGGVILGYILDSVVTGSLKVGDAATWVAAISTLGAAIGTIGSLIMLNRQHKQNIKHQERIWKKQEESLDFARYRDHKAQFEKLLDTLENKHRDFYIFKDRNTLYSRLFPINSPRNNVSDYKYKLTQSDLTEWHPLKIAWEKIDNINRILRTEGSGRTVNRMDGKHFEELPNPMPIHQIEHTIFDTARAFELRCNRTPITGDIINTGEVFSNVFDPMVMRNHSADIFDSLNEFCGLEYPPTQAVMYSPIRIGFKLLLYFTREDVPEFNNILYGHGRIVVILSKLDSFARALPNNHPFISFVRKSFGTPWDKALLKDIDDKIKVREYLDQVSIELSAIILNDEYEKDIKEQAQKISRYIRSQSIFLLS